MVGKKIIFTSYYFVKKKMILLSWKRIYNCLNCYDLWLISIINTEELKNNLITKQYTTLKFAISVWRNKGT